MFHLGQIQQFKTATITSFGTARATLTHFVGPPLCFHLVSLLHLAERDPTSLKEGGQENLQRWRTRLWSTEQEEGVT